MTSRRAFLFGAAGLLAAPAVVRAESLMKLWVPPMRHFSINGSDWKYHSLVLDFVATMESFEDNLYDSLLKHYASEQQMLGDNE